MDSIYIMGAGFCADPRNYASDPRFRKATRNMMMAFGAAQNATADLPVGDLPCGFVLGSSHGELEVTVQFLKTLSETGVARPLLFQNSLHNSTAGFISMNERLTGPMLTVSNLYFSGEDALETAVLLLREKQCEVCLVVGVEGQVQDLLPIEPKSEGAGAVLLARTEGVKALNAEPRGELTAVRYGLEGGDHGATVSSGYDSNAVELLARAVLEGRHGTLHLPKPNGGFTEIHWQP